MNSTVLIMEKNKALEKIDYVQRAKLDVSVYPAIPFLVIKNKNLRFFFCIFMTSSNGKAALSLTCITSSFQKNLAI